MPTVPEDSIEDVIARREDPTTIEPVVETVCAGFAESATAIVKLNVPLVVGVPDITPLEAAIERPTGSCPDTIDQE